jgi:hypothetical protein
MTGRKFWSAAIGLSAMMALAAGCRPNKIICPPGAQLMGQPPPQGQEIWCEKNVDGKPVKDGIFILFRDNGHRMIEGYYKDGKQNGKWTLWYENGQKKSIDHYKDGVQDGEHIGWYSNGQLAAKGMYRNGQRDGVWKRWGLSGVRNWEEVYKDGKKVS